MGALCSKPKGGATTVQKPGVTPLEMKKLTTK